MTTRPPRRAALPLLGAALLCAASASAAGPGSPPSATERLEALAAGGGRAVVPPEPAPAGGPVKHRPSGLAYDAVEDDPRHAEVFRTVDDEVKAMLAGDPDAQRRGAVHLYWSTKKSLLKHKYGIEWRDPGELNPHVIFD